MSSSVWDLACRSFLTLGRSLRRLEQVRDAVAADEFSVQNPGSFSKRLRTPAGRQRACRVKNVYIAFICQRRHKCVARLATRWQLENLQAIERQEPVQISGVTAWRLPRRRPMSTRWQIRSCSGRRQLASLCSGWRRAVKAVVFCLRSLLSTILGLMQGLLPSQSTPFVRLMPGFHHSVAVLPLPFRRSTVVKFRCSVKIT